MPGYVKRRADDALNGFVRSINRIVKILLIQNSGDIVNGALVYRKAGKTGSRENGSNFFRGSIRADSGNINPGRKDVSRLQFVKLNGIAQQLALLAVDAAALLRLFHNCYQLLFCNSLV